MSKWVRNSPTRAIPFAEIPKRLTERNLTWHQNNYNQPDPLCQNQPFSKTTPFISTTAGSVERKVFWRKNTINRAQLQALLFATNGWTTNGWLFYCYLFTLDKPSVELQQFSEPHRELHIYTTFSTYQPEGEITAKISIPTVQISHAELWEKEDFRKGRMQPRKRLNNPLYEKPEKFHNIRGYL